MKKHAFKKTNKKMTTEAKAQTILKQINNNTTKLGDLRKIASDIKKDQELALALWSTQHFYARQLAILIMDKKQLSPELIDSLVKDMDAHKEAERNQLIDWLMANQLVKDKKLVDLIESWQDSDFSLQRRVYWYYKGRQ